MVKRSPVNLLHIFRTPFLKNTFERLLLTYEFLKIMRPWQNLFLLTLQKSSECISGFQFLGLQLCFNLII